MSRAVVEGFPHRRAGHCGSGAFRDLLEHHGLAFAAEPLSEPMVFGLGSGLGFMFMELRGQELPFYVVGRGAGFEHDICGHLGIELDFRQTADPEQGWRWVREELTRGSPTMVWADIHHLDYLRVRLHNTMHDLVVLGFDDDAGVAYVADNDRDEIQECSLESLARARNSDSFPAPNRHATWLMRFPDRLPEPREAVARGLRRAIANMTESGPPGLGGVGGVEGVRRFADSYRTWPERLEQRLAPALALLSTLIVKAGTGGAMFRSLHAGFLEESAALLDVPELSEAGHAYRKLSDAWVALAEASRNPDAPVEAHAAGLPHVARILELEQSGVALMSRSLEAITG